MVLNEPPIISIAGASGDLGGRIATALVKRGARVLAMVRPSTTTADRAKLLALGVQIASADPGDLKAMATALAGSACVISALNGLSDVVIDRQGVLLDAAVAAGVPRFIPSDFAADFTKTAPGLNRNFDLRRTFMARSDQAPIKVTSILNGAFMDMLGAEMPIIQPGIHRVLYWHNADQVLDFTTKNNVADYTAAAALDPSTPRLLRIAGDSVSVRTLAATLSEVSGQRYRPLWVGTIGMLGMMIGLAKRIVPQADAPFPAWQGMQYMRDQFGGRAQLAQLDNSRYPGIEWTSVRNHLAGLEAFRASSV
ncbi:NmrA family NAD(P)-binding protein [Devosia sp.]|uniref:NmrA family NAD(P)-binding protein n=1 Tax=Devosia sp. TaxID=1871048 RepID=UPI003BACAAEC